MKYRWKTKPYAHQVRAVKWLLPRPSGGALLMEPRTGKTKTTIDYLSILAMQKKIDRVLIVCPQQVMGVWAREFGLHSPVRVHLTVWDANARRESVPPQPNPMMPYDLWVLITNYEAFSTPGRKTKSGRRSKASGRGRVRTLLKKWGDSGSAAAVLDESHKIKNPSGKAAGMIVSLRPLFKYRVLLTGTPITKAKRAHDIYMQWRFLNPSRFQDLPTAKEFREHYGTWIHRNGYPQWVRGKNLNELRRRIAADSFIVKREDCFDLPPRDEQIIKIPLKASAKAYDEMAEQMITELESGNIAEASIKIVQSLRLSQITGGCVNTTEGVSERIGFEKLDVLEDLLNEIADHDERVVIAARYRPDIRAIVALAKHLKLPTFELHGGMKRLERDRHISEFQSQEDAAVFVIQPAAGSLGIDLSAASRMVWYSLPTSWVDYTQTCDRIALSRVSTTFTYLIAKGTIDEILLESLQTDGDVAGAILSDPSRLRRSS